MPQARTRQPEDASRDDLISLGQVRDYLVSGLAPKFANLEKSVGAMRAVLRVAAAGPAPTPPARREPVAVTLAKVMTGHVIAHAEKADPVAVVERLYGPIAAPTLAAADMRGFLRKATNPAMTSVVGWAQELVTASQYAGPISAIAPQSTYAQLAARGLRLDLSTGTIRVPSRAGAAELSGVFIGEGDPLPVKGASLAAAGLAAKKAGVISVFSRELARASVPTIEAVLQQIMSEDTQAAFDGILLGTTAPTTISPGGLLYGVTPIPATAGGGLDALAADLGALANAIPGASDLVLLMNESERLRAAIWAPALATEIIGAAALPAGTIVALDAADFMSGEADDASFDVSEQGVLVTEDGAPMSNVLEGNSVSLFQQALLGLRMIADVSWAMRRPGRVAFVEDVTW